MQKTITLNVIDASKDTYNMQFAYEKSNNTIKLYCPVCNVKMRTTKPDNQHFACANGHIAFTTRNNVEEIYSLFT